MSPDEAPRYLFGTDGTGAFTGPRDALRALKDYQRGWRNTLRVTAARGLHRGPSPQVLSRPTGESKTAVLLPGVWERWEVLIPWAQALYGVGWNVEFVPELDMQFGTLDGLAETLVNHLEKNDLKDVLLVAHSKGGLVGKTAMTRPPGSRIEKMIAVGTPFSGAPIAALTPGGMQMRTLVPWNEEIQSLSQHLEPNSRIVAIQAQWDQNVPPDPDLPGATLITAPVAGHTRLLAAPEVIALIALHAGSGWVNK